MKKGKNVKINGYDRFKVNYGTVDYKNFKSVYLNIQTWAEPVKDLCNPSKTISSLSRSIKYTILDSLQEEIFQENFIVDLDLRSSGIHLGKKSFMNLECVFYVKGDEISFKSNEIKSSIKSIADTIVKNNLARNNAFMFHSTKN